MHTAIVFLLALLADYGPFFHQPYVSLDDLVRFPPPWACEENLRFIDAHQAWLWGQWQPGTPDCRYWCGRYYDMNFRRAAWDQLRLVYMLGDDERRALAKLRRLRDMIGEWEYENGLMPLPCWIEEFWIDE